MTCVERIIEYTRLPSEPLHLGKTRLKNLKWPEKGEIELKNASLSYDKNLPNVLHNITLKIEAGEKIGIVGRTGAGKSSLIQMLFRMYEPNEGGEIRIDGLEIRDLSLHELRNKLTIIPVSI